MSPQCLAHPASQLGGTTWLVTFTPLRMSWARFAWAGFVSAYALAWTAFGLLAFLGDLILHHVVDATPWLAANEWLINASLLGAAGAYQFTPWKRRRC